jgi:hypothetical protein
MASSKEIKKQYAKHEKFVGGIFYLPPSSFAKTKRR